MSGNHPNYYIKEIGQNTEKSPEETCCHSDLSEKPSANAGEENSKNKNRKKPPFQKNY